MKKVSSSQDNETNDFEEIKETTNEKKTPLLKDEGKVLFSTNKVDEESCRLVGNPVALISTNIPSFMGGRNNFWKNSKNKVALQNPYRSQTNELP